MAVNWGYYDKFDGINDKYLLERGEGSTKATQIVTCINKLVYKWYNDGDVFDNTKYLEGWANDLSDYANWLYQNTTENVQVILDTVYGCYTDSEYEDLLQELTDELFKEEYLAEQNKLEKVGTVYECNGKFKFVDIKEDEEDYYDYDEEEDEDEEDYY